eukprot:6383478-Amphidinium_carterae.1
MALLADLGMVEASPQGSAVKHSGEEVRNGLFGVHKKWVELADGVRHQVLRLICNLTPTNALQCHYPGEASTMGYPILWTQLVLLDGEVMLLASVDQVGSFHCYALPPVWRPYFVLDRRCSPGVLSSTACYPRFRIVPMGWIQAVDVVQEAHRHLIENCTQYISARDLKCHVLAPNS